MYQGIEAKGKLRIGWRRYGYNELRRRGGRATESRRSMADEGFLSAQESTKVKSPVQVLVWAAEGMAGAVP